MALPPTAVALSVKGESFVGSDDGQPLVIMGGNSAGGSRAALPDGFPIVHALSPRVLVIGPPVDTSAADVAALPGVEAVRDSDVGSEILDGLDETEILFVEAWSKRKGESKTQRRGEGLACDVDGFEPPDAPPKLDSD